MQTIADYFYVNAKEYAEKKAIICDEKYITYGELNKMVNRYSNYLLEMGVKYGDNVGMIMNNSIESVAIMLVASNIGIGIVPINGTLSEDSIIRTFKCCDVKHIIARKMFYKQFFEDKKYDVEGRYFCIDGEYPGTDNMLKYMEMDESRPDSSKVNGNEVYIITTTSGSTGDPKPIILSQNVKINRAKRHIEMYQLDKDDIILAATPLYHSLAERLVIMPLIMGATSVILPRYTSRLWLECIKKHNITFTIAVSAQLNRIVDIISSPEFSKESFSSMKCIVSSSALLDLTIKEKLVNVLECEFHEMYGTSETSTITDIRFDSSERKLSSVGKSINGAQIKIVKDDNSECNSNEIGEILCCTDLICEGYYNKMEAFYNNCIDNFFKTGDMGYLDQEGYLYFTGRKKEIIITGGINVYPIDVENCILRLEEVKECVAFSYPDNSLVEIVAVAIVLKKGYELAKRKVKFWCAKYLADYQQPHKIFIVDKLPRNSMGKIVKTGLVEYVIENEIVKEDM